MGQVEKNGKACDDKYMVRIDAVGICKHHRGIDILNRGGAMVKLWVSLRTERILNDTDKWMASNNPDIFG